VAATPLDVRRPATARAFDVSKNDVLSLLDTIVFRYVRGPAMQAEAEHTHDPLKVLEVLVGLVVGVMAVLATLTVAGTVLGSGTVPGLSAEVCATLGRILIAWAVLDFVVSGWVNAAMLNRMTDSALILTATVPWLPVLLGIALLALASVMGQAVGMRRDVEATI
jgi:hypothetical protein